MTSQQERLQRVSGLVLTAVGRFLSAAAAELGALVLLQSQLAAPGAPGPAPSLLRSHILFRLFGHSLFVCVALCRREAVKAPNGVF